MNGWSRTRVQEYAPSRRHPTPREAWTPTPGPAAIQYRSLYLPPSFSALGAGSGILGMQTPRAVVAAGAVAEAHRRGNDMDTIPQKVCTKCGQSMPATSEYFSAGKKCRDGFRGTCKKCAVAYSREHYLKNIDARNAYMAARARALYVPKPRLPRSKTCSRCGVVKPGTREHFALKRQYCRACGVAAEAANREAHRQASLAPERSCGVCHEVKPNTLGFFYAGGSGTCKECWKARTKAWLDANPEARRAKGNNRRAKIKAAGGTFGKADVRAKLAHQKNTCYWCKAPLDGTYHVDHVIPLSKGGSNGPGNIVCACSTCNLAKAAQMPWEFANRLF